MENDPKIRGAESMVMKFHGNVRGEVRVNFLALFVSKPHIFMCGALNLSGIARTNVRLNIAIPMLFWSLKRIFKGYFLGNMFGGGKCRERALWEWCSS